MKEINASDGNGSEKMPRHFYLVLLLLVELHGDQAAGGEAAVGNVAAVGGLAAVCFQVFV